MKEIKSHSCGMTLIEMLVAVGLMTILSLAISTSTVNFYKTQSYALEQANEIDNARRGMTEWNRDAKELETGADGSFPVSIIEPHKFGYYSDTDKDSEVEYIEYQLSGTTLTKRTYNATGNPLVYNLTTPSSTEILSLYVQNINQATSTFFYYDNNGTQLNATSPRVNVRYIKAQIIVNIDPSRSPGEFMLRSSIAPRNLKDNL
jgi:prepilin-type N-terminal cleavage/methylation domain-containing protein